MMKFIKSRLNKKGFTLVELLIVIAVLGIIAGIGVNSMSGITDTFKVKADEETARILARQVEVAVLAGVQTDNEVVAVADAPNPQSDPDEEFVLTLSGMPENNEDPDGEALITVTITDNNTFEAKFTITDKVVD